MQPPERSAAWPRLREISRHGYLRHRRLWNRLRWSSVGRTLRGFYSRVRLVMHKAEERGLLRVKHPATDRLDEPIYEVVA